MGGVRDDECRDLTALYEFLHSLPSQAGQTGDPRFRKG
jgi:hypothetical protein